MQVFPDERSRVNAIEDILEKLRRTGQRVRIFYGRDGVMWMEEHDVMGYIGRSTGPQPIYLLLSRDNSRGGHGILTSSIVRIYDTGTKKEIFSDGTPFPVLSVRYVGIENGMHTVYVINNTAHVASFSAFNRPQAEEKAQRYIKFMTAQRFSK
jgi:hypothetical protein